MKDNNLNHAENKEESAKRRILSAIKTVPPSDVNFQSALKDADIDAIRQALSEIPEENNKSRIKILTSKLNALEKSRPKALREDLETRKVALEEKGWSFHIGEKSGFKRFEKQKMDAKLERAVSIEHLLSQAEALDLSHTDFSDESDGDEQTILSAETVRSIPIGKIIPSPFEPQTRRRTKFLDNEISALAGSIKQFGLRQPILVRPRFDEFEIVFGERRFLACAKSGLDSVNCFVESLSDAEVIELQYEENHNRLEPDPLDDAFTFHYLQTEKGYSIEDLSIKFAMDKSSVRRRLKLNDLIGQAKELLSSGKIPLGHAVFMAALPADAQQEIIDEGILFEYTDGPVYSLAEFKEEVEDEIVRDLSKAPFDTIDPRLHIKNLICPDCTQRTGYEPKLFDEDFGRGDKCLNKQCFELKTNVHLKLKREEIAAKIQLPVTTDNDDSPGNSDGDGGAEKILEKKIASVPLVTERSYVDKNDLPIKGKILTNQTLLDDPECEFSERGLGIAGEKKGQEVWICRNDKCPVHHPEKIAPEEKTAIPDFKLRQLENDYQIKVGMTVRERVFAKSIEHFNGYNSFFQNADLVEKLLVEIISLRFSYLQEIKNIFKEWKNFPKSPVSRQSIETFVAELDTVRRDQILFLCIFASDGYMVNGEYKSQTEIEKLAKSYAKLDYGDLDADVRVELAPDEFKAIAEEYRTDYQNGEPIAVPRFWWEGFEFPD